MPTSTCESGLVSFSHWHQCPGGRRLRWCLAYLTPQGVKPVGLVEANDELVLFLEVGTASRQPARPTQLTVEWWSGEERRDVWHQAICEPRASLALRLRNSDRIGRSSQLRCRFVLDGHEVGHALVLQGRPPVDAQGRL